ncbi:unnamed protein product [Prunus armeniaca]|uniref:Formin-like protein n=1 Tax=Prunus armeniaca TaxID=36596 RepID=A0A6J5VLS2_PRUAR|nr:unnamed protein product [Prunus armeniaca]
MALLRKLFYRKPPDGLFEISERVYVFDCCFTTDAWKEENYKVYIGGIVGQLQDHLPDASFLVFNFHDGVAQSQMASILSEYDMTIMDYPRHFEGCPVLTLELIHHFLRSSESWLALGQHNVLLMHCERGGWPVLAFMLAALLIYRKQYSGEQRTLDMVYRQAPHELLHFLSPLNPIPSQLRYLQYVSRRNVALEWPPLDRALTLDCVIFRFIPNFDGEGGCRPLFRIYGQDPFVVTDRTPRVLYSTPKRSHTIRAYKQAECELVKIDINCHIQGDVVVECISLHDDTEREEMMFRIMFNTAFIRSNILMLNRDEIDMLWDAKEQFPKNFRVEILFSEMDAAKTASIILGGISCFEDKEGLPMEAFAQVQEIFNYVDWLDPKVDATLNALHQMGASNIAHEKLDNDSSQSTGNDTSLQESSPRNIQKKKKQLNLENNSKTLLSLAEVHPVASPLQSPDATVSKQEAKPQDIHTAIQLPSQCDSVSQHIPQPSQSTPMGAFAQVQEIFNHVASPAQSPSTTASKQEAKPQDIHTALQPPNKCDSVCQQMPRPSQSTPMEAFTQVQEIFSHVASHMQSPDTAVSKQDGKPEDIHTALESPNQHDSVCQKMPQPSQSTPVSSNSRKDLPEPTPKYQNTCQASGIKPLLNDHDFSGRQEVSHSVTAYPAVPDATLNVSRVPESAEVNSVSITAPTPSSPPPLRPSMATSTIKTLSSPPPQQVPPSVSKPEDSSLSKDSETYTQDGTHPSITSHPGAHGMPISGTISGSVLPDPPSAPPHSQITTSARPPPTPPPPPPTLPLKENLADGSGPPPPPPPPPPTHSGQAGGTTNSSPVPPPPPTAATASVPSAPPCSTSFCSKNNNAKKLKPLHWLKLSRAVQGSLWAEAQKSGEASKAPEIDISELENLFSAAVPTSDHGRKSTTQGSVAPKSDKVQLIDHRRAYNCEIMLSKVKVPLNELMKSVLALEDTALDADQVENLIKFCPTKEEMELLKGYTGEKEKLGKCEQIRNSVKLKRIMQTILSLGNALNQGTARGSAIGFRLDSLLKLIETRARNHKMTLMHYLCKVLIDQLPEVLDFSKDLASLEPASKIQLKFLAEEMQAVSKGLEKVVQELSTSENDGPISENFRKILKEFLRFAEAEVRTLASLYSTVGRNVDALILYFGEDPARCPFEQVVSTLLNFVRMFIKAHDENCKQSEIEKKKAAESEKPKMGASKESERLSRNPIKSGNT